MFFCIFVFFKNRSRPKQKMLPPQSFSYEWNAWRSYSKDIGLHLLCTLGWLKRFNFEFQDVWNAWILHSWIKRICILLNYFTFCSQHSAAAGNTVSKSELPLFRLTMFHNLKLHLNAIIHHVQLNVLQYSRINGVNFYFSFYYKVVLTEES